MSILSLNKVKDIMILIIKQLLLTWNSERNQRIKLQQVYFSLAILLTIGAGLMTLLNAYVGHK